jgi:hypothetical protein
MVIDNRAIAKAFVREFDGLMSTTDAQDPRIATAGMGGDTEGLVDAVEGERGE